MYASVFSLRTHVTLATFFLSSLFSLSLFSQACHQSPLKTFLYLRNAWALLTLQHYLQVVYKNATGLTPIDRASVAKKVRRRAEGSSAERESGGEGEE